jgi:hypothetical protein
MNFLEQLQQQYGPQVAQQLSSRFGLNPEQAEAVLPRMAPFVLGGVQAQMQHDTDEENAQRVLQSHADESGLDDVDGYFERSAQTEADPEEKLNGLFGHHAPQAKEAMAKQLGVSPDLIAKILPVIAPLILGAVMNKMKNPGSAGGPGNSGGGGGMDILGSILGQAGGSRGGAGGDLLSTILGQVMSGGGGAGATGGLAQKAGCLSAILGGLLKGKR